jgi:hypothetical protein
MKRILALTLATLTAMPAFADENASDMKHMLTFDADSIIQGVWSFQKSKTPGRKADNDTTLKLDLNYFYALDMHPKLQVGGSVNYGKTTNYLGDNENYGFKVGAIYNTSENLTQSFYGKALVGMDWNRTYGSSSGNSMDEVLNWTLAVGKRMSLARFGIKHLTYTPEIAWTNANSTTGGNFEYNQAVQFRFLQFAVFF